MAREAATGSALDAAYGVLARRPHSCRELKAKLLRKGFTAQDIDAALEVLVRQGCLNDEATAFRWAQARVQQRLWGRAKIDGYLARKGIDRDIIAQVQKAVWQTCSEEDIARQALAKRFPSFHDHRSAYAKAAAFLKSRGFSSEVIYKLVSELDA